MTLAATAERPRAAAPAQPELAGMPPAEPGLRVAIVGHLQRRGELRISTDGRAHLLVQVLQPRDGLAFVAIQHEQAGGATRADLEHLVRNLPAGAAVIVTGHGIQLAEHEGQQVLRIARCSAVCAADPALYFPPATPLQEAA